MIARGTPARLGLIGTAIVALTLIGPTLHREAGDLAFIAVALTQGGLVLRATVLAADGDVRASLAVVVGVAILVRLLLLVQDPHLSTDAYRYVWDGRVQNAGINPYRFIPYAPELAHLRDTVIFPNINRADYAVTIYPPAAQLLFFVVGWIADGLLALKLALLAFEAVTVLVLRDLLRRFGQPATRIVAYAWHPLTYWEIAGSAHVDAAMIGILMLGVWLVVVGGRRVLGAATLAVATLIKPFAVLALVVAWRPWDWRAPAAAVAVAGALYVPYLSVGWGVLGFLPTYVGEERIDTGQGFWLVFAAEQLIGPQPWLGPAYLAGGAALLGWLLLRMPFDTDQTAPTVLRRLFWLLLAAVWLVSPNLPWYWMVLVPFVTLSGTAVGWAATLGAFVLYEEVWNDLNVSWALRDTLFNLTVLGALAWTLRPVAQAKDGPA